MKVFITGASGFIGQNLIKEIINFGWEPVCFVLPQESLTALQGLGAKHFITDLNDLPEISAVVHLAARVHQMNDTSADPLAEFRKVNVDFALAVAKKALEKGVKKFVFVSTVKVFGEGPGSFNEESLLKPEDAYSQSKLEAELALQNLFANSSSKLVIIRFPMVYGPCNKGNMISLLKAAKKKLPLPIGRASGKRSMVYVGNVASAINTILNFTKEEKQFDNFNLTDGQDISSNDLYRMINFVFDGKFRTFNIPEMFFILAGKILQKFNRIYQRLFSEYRFQNTKFCTTYNWKPPVSVEEGIKATVTWYSAK